MTVLYKSVTKMKFNGLVQKGKKNTLLQRIE